MKTSKKCLGSKLNWLKETYNRKKAFKCFLADDKDNIGVWRSVRRTVIFQQWSSESERSRRFCFEWKQKGHFSGSSAGYAISFHRSEYQRAKEVGQSVLHHTDCFWSQVWGLFATVVWGTDDYRVADSFCHSYCLTAQHWNKHRHSRQSVFEVGYCRYSFDCVVHRFRATRLLHVLTCRLNSFISDETVETKAVGF